MRSSRANAGETPAATISDRNSQMIRQAILAGHIGIMVVGFFAVGFFVGRGFSRDLTRRERSGALAPEAQSGCPSPVTGARRSRPMRAPRIAGSGNLAGETDARCFALRSGGNLKELALLKRAQAGDEVRRDLMDARIEITHP